LPKEGFTALTVSVSLKDQLVKTAEALGYKTVPALIRDLLAGTSKSTSTQALNGGSQAFETGFKNGFIPKTERLFLVRPPGFEPGIAGLEGLPHQLD